MKRPGVEEESLAITVLENRIHVPNMDEMCAYLERPGSEHKLAQVGRSDELPQPLERLTIAARNERERLRLLTNVVLGTEIAPDVVEGFRKHVIVAQAIDPEVSPAQFGYERKVKPTPESGVAVYKAPTPEKSGLKAAVSLKTQGKSPLIAQITNAKNFQANTGKKHGTTSRSQRNGSSIRPRHVNSIETDKYIEDFLELSLIAVSALLKYGGHRDPLPSLKVRPVEGRSRAITVPKDIPPAPLQLESRNRTSYESSEVRHGDMPDIEKLSEEEATAPRTVRLEDIGGHEDIKRQIRRIALSFKKPEIAELWGQPAVRKILLYGPAGTGKTMLAQAIATEVGAEFTEIISTEINDMYIGNSAKNMQRKLEDLMGATEPTIVLMDEFDTIIQQKSTSGEKAEVVGVYKRMLNDLTKKNPNIILVATTNHEDLIGDDVKRRFNKHIYVPKPDEDGRKQIWSNKLEPLWQTGRADFSPLGNMDLNELQTIVTNLAQQSEGLTGADIEKVIEAVCELKMEEHMIHGTFEPIISDDITEALQNFRTQRI